MLAIFKREFNSYMNTVTGPLFVAVNLFFLGIYFVAYHLYMGEPRVAYTVQSVIFVFLIVTPVLTMRSMAQERRQRTDQLLFTSPVSPAGIILGKYFGMVSVFLLPVLVLCAYPLVLSIYGKVPMAESYVSILAYFLFGSACISIGLFMSSLTENLIIAAVGTFGTLLLGYLMAGIKAIISQSGNNVTKVLTAFDIASPMDNMMQGIIDVPAIIYYLSVIVFMLFLTFVTVTKRRYEVHKDTIKTYVFSYVAVIALAAALVGINIAADHIPDDKKNIDVTENQMSEITDTTLNYLKGIDSDVTIYVLNTEDACDETIKQILGRYTSATKHIKTEYKDISAAPDFATQYGVDNATPGSLIVVSDLRSKYVDYNSLYETTIDYQTYSQKVTGIDAEGQITSALDYVLSGDMPYVYVIEGHNELKLSDHLTQLVEKANIDVRTLNLMNTDSIEDEAGAVFILAPTVDYTADDVAKVEDYLSRGHSALIVSSYSPESMTNFNGIMESYGVDTVGGIVIEGDPEHYYQSPVNLLPQLGASMITSDLMSSNRLVLMPYAQGATFGVSDNEARSVTKLLSTTDTAYLKTDTQNAQSMEKEAGDVDGPFELGLMVEDEQDGKKTSLLYFTSESILDDSVDSMVSGANSALVAKGITQMVGEKESTIAIPAKSYESEKIVVPDSTTLMLAIIVVGVVPLLIMLAGIFVWNRRRKR